MTTPQDTAQAGGTAPVACRLTPADLAAQADRWTRLLAMALTERTETADGVRLSFQPEPGTAEELRALAAVESECCPWADWTVDTSAGAVVLDVRSGAEGLAALHGMFRRVGMLVGEEPTQRCAAGPPLPQHARVIPVTRWPAGPASAG